MVNKCVRRCLLAEHEVRGGTGCYTNLAERLSARYRHGDVYRNAEPDIHWHAVCACHWVSGLLNKRVQNVVPAAIMLLFFFIIYYFFQIFISRKFVHGFVCISSLLLCPRVIFTIFTITFFRYFPVYRDRLPFFPAIFFSGLTAGCWCLNPRWLHTRHGFAAQPVEGYFFGFKREHGPSASVIFLPTFRSPDEITRRKLLVRLRIKNVPRFDGAKPRSVGHRVKIYVFSFRRGFSCSESRDIFRIQTRASGALESPRRVVFGRG